MAMAQMASSMSMDAQTQVGCVLTNKRNRIIGIGYNSFPREMVNEKLPNVRPKEGEEWYKSKYPWMTHAEKNAVRNCLLKPNDSVVAYVTGPCCFSCTEELWGFGVTQIFELKTDKIKSVNEEDRVLKEVLCSQTSLKITQVELDLSKFKKYLED